MTASMNPDTRHPRVTMREIAAQLGVSHVTVSMAMRHSPRVSAATRERILKKAEELGYRPDPMLTALANYRNQRSAAGIKAVVAWINAWEHPEDLRAYKEFDLYWKGASDCAAKLGYRLEEFRLDRGTTPERLHQVLQTRGIQGILLPPHGLRQPSWEAFPWEAYTVARFGRSLRFPSTHLITADQLANTYTAVSRMRERGYRRIGSIAYAIDLDPRGPHFTAGLLSARAQLPDVGPLPIFRMEKQVSKDLLKRFRHWMEKERPDALLCTVNPMALLHQAGYRVPADIAIAVTSVHDGGVDSGMDQHPEEIGRVGFLFLNSQINERVCGIPEIPRQILVEGSWRDGSSLPDRRTR